MQNPQYNGTTRPIPNYPALRHAIWLEANRRYGLLRRLGRGSDREAWITRDGRVFKMPHEPLDHNTERKYTDQNAHELDYITRNRHKPWVPECEGVYIFGVLCLLMERVYELEEWFGEGIRDLYPHQHAFYDKGRPTEEYISDGCQGGFNRAGVYKVYDLGIQTRSRSVVHVTPVQPIKP